MDHHSELQGNHYMLSKKALKRVTGDIYGRILHQDWLTWAEEDWNGMVSSPIDAEYYRDLVDETAIEARILYIEGLQPKLHKHIYSNECCIVLSKWPYSKAYMEMNGKKTYGLQRGRKYFFPQGRPHTYSTPQKTVLVLLSVQNPPIGDDYE